CDGTRRPDAYRGELVRSGPTSLVMWPDTGETGVYRLKTGKGRTVWYVVQPDSRESDLTPLSDAQKEKVRQTLPLTEVAERESLKEVGYGRPPVLAVASTTEELGWVFLLGVVALLCLEVWLTRRIVTAGDR